MEISQMLLRPVGVVRSKEKVQSLVAGSKGLKWQARLEEAKEEQA